MFGLVGTCFSQCECVVILYVCYHLTSEPPNLRLCLTRSKTVQKHFIICEMFASKLYLEKRIRHCIFTFANMSATGASRAL